MLSGANEIGIEDNLASLVCHFHSVNAKQQVEYKALQM